jgi:hypothetical protein
VLKRSLVAQEVGISQVAGEAPQKVGYQLMFESQALITEKT